MTSVLMYSWGAGTNGQLGHGVADDAFRPVQTHLEKLRELRPLHIANGGSHAVVAFGELAVILPWLINTPNFLGI